MRSYVMDVEGGAARAFTPESQTEAAEISPDGKLLVVDGGTTYPIDPGEARPIAGLDPKDSPVQWSADGRTLFVTRFGELPLRVFRLDMATGKKELWKEIVPADRAGLIRIERLVVSRDARSYAYSYNRVSSSDLYLVTGWE